MPGQTAAVSTDHLSFYRANARQIAEGIRSDWELSARQDVKSLVDDVQCALSAEANLELRQVLFQLMAQVELALVKSKTQPESAMGPERLQSMRDALDRAARVVDVYLDRNQAAQFVIPLHEEPFDLGAGMREMLRLNGFLHGAVRVELEIEPCEIVGDRDRLMDVLAHLVTRFFFAHGPGEHLRVTLSSVEGGVEGFVGLTHSHIPTQDLMSEFDQPLTIEDMQLDIPYCRAVIERHGGTLYVAAGQDDANGFGFTLPSSGASPET